MELVAFLGEDKETWGQITGLINHGSWEKVILIKHPSASSFPIPVNGEEIYIDPAKSLIDTKTELMTKLKPKLGGFEVAVSIASGKGKEHMALIASLLSIPVGIRLVVFTKNGVESIT